MAAPGYLFVMFALLFSSMLPIFFYNASGYKTSVPVGGLKGRGTAHFKDLGKVIFFSDEDVEAFFTINISDLYKNVSRFSEYLKFKLPNNSLYTRDVTLILEEMAWLMNNATAFETTPSRLERANYYQINDTRKRQNLDYVYRLYSPFRNSFYSLDYFFNYTNNLDVDANDTDDSLLSSSTKRVLTEVGKFIDEIYQVLYENTIPSVVFPPMDFLKALNKFANEAYIEFPYPLKRDYYPLYRFISSCKVFRHEAEFLFLVNIPIKALPDASTDWDFRLYSITPLYYGIGSGIKIPNLRNNFFIYNTANEYYLELRDLSSCKNVGARTWFCRILTNVKKFLPSTASCEALLFRDDKRAPNVCRYIFENRLLGLQSIRVDNELQCYNDDGAEDENFKLRISCRYLQNSTVKRINKSPPMVVKDMMVCYPTDDGCIVDDEYENYQFPYPPHRAIEHQSTTNGKSISHYNFFRTYKQIHDDDQNFDHQQRGHNCCREEISFDKEENDGAKNVDLVVIYALVCCIFLIIVLCFVFFMKTYSSLSKRVESLDGMKKEYEDCMNRLRRKQSMVSRNVDGSNRTTRISIPTNKPPPVPLFPDAFFSKKEEAALLSPTIAKENPDDPKKQKESASEQRCHGNVDDDGYIICNAAHGP